MKIIPQSKHDKVRFAIVITVFFAISLYFFALPYLLYYQYKPKVGDIVFQSLPNMSNLVKAIEGISESPYSHCGVVVEKNGKWYVNEALGSVHDTPLLDWIKRGRGYRVDVFRLRSKYSNLIPQFIEELSKYQGKPYDFRYRMNDSQIYCSELVFKAYKDAANENLGELVKLGDMNWKPYIETILEYEGSTEPPLERIMITPKHLSQAAQLEVMQKLGLRTGF